MKFFSGLKARKLTRAIENYPTVFKNYQDLISLYISEDNIAEARSVSSWQSSRPGPQPSNRGLHVQQLKIHSSVQDDPTLILDSALDVMKDQSIDTHLRMEAALTAAPLLLRDKDALSDDKALETIHAFDSIIESLPDHVGIINTIPVICRSGDQDRSSIKRRSADRISD